MTQLFTVYGKNVTGKNIYAVSYKSEMGRYINRIKKFDRDLAFSQAYGFLKLLDGL